MKLICNGTELSDAFNKVVKAISAKSNLPILEGIKISAYGNELKLTATDTEFTIEKIINADIMQDGEALVKGRFTADLVRVMNNQTIEITADDKMMVFKNFDSVINVKCMDINEYPPIIDVQGEYNVKINSNELKKLINQSIFCVAQDDIKPVLKGCLLKLSKDNIRCVALDGYRLAVIDKDINYGNEDLELIIPNRALIEISKLLHDDELVNININKKRIIIDMNHTKVISSLIEGEYVNYNVIIPKSFAIEAVMIRNQLLEILTRVAIIAKNNKSNLIKLDFKENLLILTASSDLGDIEEKIGINFSGSDITIGINYKYILDCIEAMEEEYIRISINSSYEPIVITPIDNDKYLCLVLPIRIIN